MSRKAKLSLLYLTLVPTILSLIVLVGGFIFQAFHFTRLFMSGPKLEWGWLLLLLPWLLLCLLFPLYLVEFIYYTVHILRNPRLSLAQRVEWLLAMFLTGGNCTLMYWHQQIWKDGMPKAGESGPVLPPRG